MWSLRAYRFAPRAEPTTWRVVAIEGFGQEAHPGRSTSTSTIIGTTDTARRAREPACQRGTVKTRHPHIRQHQIDVVHLQLINRLQAVRCLPHGIALVLQEIRHHFPAGSSSTTRTVGVDWEVALESCAERFKSRTCSLASDRYSGERWHGERTRVPFLVVGTCDSLSLRSIYATPHHDRRTGRELATRGRVSRLFGRCGANQRDPDCAVSIPPSGARDFKIEELAP